MNFSLTGSQRQIAQSARAWLAESYPAQRIAAIADGPTGVDLSSWEELVRQGWLDDDLGLVELGLLAVESGYALQPTPWLSTVTLPLPLFEPRPSALVTGAFSAEGSLLSGAGLAFVYGAQRLVVLADGEFFAVESGEPGVVVEQRDSFDRLRRVATVKLRQVPAKRLAHAADVTPALQRRAKALFACEGVGVAERAMDFAVEYAKIREQFGRPIGTFQAVAHQLADGYVELELARSLAYRAAWLLGAGELDEMALAAAVSASRNAALRCCEIALQVLGGIGATWEHPLHLWLRRAWWWQASEPSATDAHELIAAALLDGALSTVPSS